MKHGEHDIFLCPLPKNSHCWLLAYDGHSALTFIKNLLDTSTFFLSGHKSTMIVILLLLKIIIFIVTEFLLPLNCSAMLNTVKSTIMLYYFNNNPFFLMLDWFLTGFPCCKTPWFTPYWFQTFNLLLIHNKFPFQCTAALIFHKPSGKNPINNFWKFK